MRRPFFMDDLSPDDQRTVRRLFLGILSGYTAIILLVFATVIVRNQLTVDDRGLLQPNSIRASPADVE